MISREQVYQETLHFVSGNDDYVVSRNWTNDILKKEELEGQLEMQQGAWRVLNRELSWVIDERDELAEALRIMLESSEGLSVGQTNRDKALAALKQLEDKE